MRIQAEANLSALIESTEDLIWSVDPRLRLITFNRAFQEHFERNFGGPVAPGMSMNELLPPERAISWPPLYQRALKEEKFRAEITLIDGRVLDLSFSPILVDGETTGVSVFGKDVTKAKAAEKKYRDIFEGALEGFFQTTPEGKLVTANRTLAKMLGYDSPAEAVACITDSAHQLWMDPDERARVTRQIEENRYIQDYECQFMRKDGGLIWVLLNCRYVRDVGGQVILFEGSIQDITERKRAEDAVKKTEANLSALIESSRDLIWAVDLDDRMTAFNGAWREHFEKNYHCLPQLGMRAEELVEPERRQLMPALYRHTLVEGPFRTEFRLSDGRILEMALNPILVDGKAIGVSVFGKDITERKRSETLLRDSEELYRATFEQVAFGIAHCTFEGIYLRGNHRFAEIIGYPPEEIPGLTIQQVTAPEDLTARMEVLERISSGETASVKAERRYLRKDGSLRWARSTLSVQRDGEGRPLHLITFVEDIHDRKQAEAQLRESRDFLTEAQRIGNLGCYVLDFASGFWSSTPQLDEVFGIGSDYLRSVAGWAELVHPEDRDLMTAYFENEVAAKGMDFDKEYRIARAPDGAERWVHGMGRLEFDAQGRPTKMRGIIRDITGHKRAEIAIEEREKLYRAITESSPLAYVITTRPEDRIEYVNPAFIELFGYAREEIPTTAEWGMLAYPDPEYRAWAMAEWQRKIPRAFAPGSAMEPIETEITCKNGSKKSVVWGFVKLGDRNLAYGLDITERKQAEQQLLASEERYRSTFEQAPVGIIHTALDGRFLRCNTRFAEIIGYPRDEVPGLSFQQITVPEDLDSALQARERLLREESTTIRTEKQHIRKDGSRIWVRLSLTARRNSQGHIQYFIVIVEDIQARKIAEERLAATTRDLQTSEERYRLAFDTSPDAVNIARVSDGMILDVNQKFMELTGYRREELVGRTTLQTGIWFDADERQKLLDTLRQKLGCRDAEFRFRRKGGEVFWGRLSVSQIEISGEPCLFSFARDITREKEDEERLDAAAEALSKSEERYRTAFQTSIDAININRLSDGLYVDCNQAFLDILGYEREEVIGKTSQELNVWADGRDRQAMVEMVLQNSSCRGLEAQFKKKNGEIVWGEMSASRIEIDGAECILSITRDISHEKLAENTIRNLAFYDSLTGLPNRRFLSEKLYQIQAAPRSGHSQALLFVELDHFKTLNETLGHLTGDLLLKEIAQRICACTGPADIVCRLGGDEFAVMLDDLSESVEEAAAQAMDVGERIRASIGLPCFLDGRECITTASIGCTILGAGEQSIDDLMQEADIALYQAKLAGRNAMRFFSPALQSAVNARATLEEDMRQAIKGKQFLLYYQPQVQRGRLIGAEALIRWMHPKNGMVPPDAFIPLAEETGLILPVGDWVLDAACRQIAAWADRMETAHLTVAVNISALQFRQPGFVETVLNALERTGANPRNLKLELTESMLVENIEDVIIKMTVLKKHGLSFSLDDFGTGYSSLAYLKRLPLDQLKIDRAFVRDMLVDVTSGAIAQTIISLGSAMGLSVIAEGVETEEQRGFLAGLGCHAFQGTLFSPPLPLVEFESFI